MLLQLLYVRGAAEHVDKKRHVSTSMQEANWTVENMIQEKSPRYCSFSMAEAPLNMLIKKGLPRSKKKRWIFSHVGYA